MSDRAMRLVRTGVHAAEPRKLTSAFACNVWMSATASLLACCRICCACRCADSDWSNQEPCDLANEATAATIIA